MNPWNRTIKREYIGRALEDAVIRITSQSQQGKAGERREDVSRPGRTLSTSHTGLHITLRLHLITCHFKSWLFTVPREESNTPGIFLFYFEPKNSSTEYDVVIYILCIRQNI